MGQFSKYEMYQLICVRENKGIFYVTVQEIKNLYNLHPNIINREAPCLPTVFNRAEKVNITAKPEPIQCLTK